LQREAQLRDDHAAATLPELNRIYKPHTLCALTQTAFDEA